MTDYSSCFDTTDALPLDTQRASLQGSVTASVESEGVRPRQSLDAVTCYTTDAQTVRPYKS